MKLMNQFLIMLHNAVIIAFCSLLATSAIVGMATVIWLVFGAI